MRAHEGFTVIEGGEPGTIAGEVLLLEPYEQSRYWFLDYFPDLMEMPDEARVVSARFEFGEREDGTQQVAFLFGGNHTWDPENVLFGHMRTLEHRLRSEIADPSRVVGLMEGRVRELDPKATDEQIIHEQGELAFFQRLVENAGVKRLGCLEPENELLLLLSLGRHYGYRAVNYYLTARMWLQLYQMPESMRPTLSTYLIKDMAHRYPDILKAGSEAGEEMGVLGFKRMWDALHPEYNAPLEELFTNPKLAQITHDETRHIPLLMAARQGRRPANMWNEAERLAVHYNYERDLASADRVRKEIARGNDVVCCAADVHLLAMLESLCQEANGYHIQWGEQSLSGSGRLSN